MLSMSRPYAFEVENNFFSLVCLLYFTYNYIYISVMFVLKVKLSRHFVFTLVIDVLTFDLTDDSCSWIKLVASE